MLRQNILDITIILKFFENLSWILEKEDKLSDYGNIEDFRKFQRQNL